MRFGLIPKIIFGFYRIKQLIFKYDPIKLLSQSLITFLTTKEGQFNAESSEIVLRARWIEFVAGFICSRKLKNKYVEEVDGNVLEKVDKLVSQFFINVSLYVSLSKRRENKSYRSVIKSAKLHSLIVRGETYPFYLAEMGKSLYSNFDEWFQKKLGFKFLDAVTLTSSITELINKRINEEKRKTKAQTKKIVKNLISEGGIDKANKTQVEISYWAKLFFGNCEQFLSFSTNELSDFSGIPENICENYLRRMSQEFGYRNKLYKSTFINPFKSCWDYNTLYEKPIIKFGNLFYVPVPSLLSEVLFNTYYYDLIEDEDYWRTCGEKVYGKWLEEKTADCFRKIFPSNSVIMNPCYEKGKELCDVIVLFDRKIFIVQCKTKRMQYESKIGTDFNKLRSDFEKGIKLSFEQALKAKKYIENNEYPELIINKGKIIIDKNQISEIYLMCVTLNSYQNLTTRFANLESELRITKENQYPWAISLFDLSILSEILTEPYLFIQYARRRLAIENTEFEIVGDEVDLLGFYLNQGLYLEGQEFNDIDGAYFSGYSDEVDKYFFEKYENHKNPKKPEPKIRKLVMRYIDAIKKINPPYKTDCIIRLLDMSDEGRENIIKGIEHVKSNTIKDNNLHSLSTIMNNREFGISFVSMNSQKDIRLLYQQVFSFASIKKYEEKCKEWVGFGWEKNSNELLDVAIFLFGEESYDPTMEQILKENKKEGYFLELSRNK